MKKRPLSIIIIALIYLFEPMGNVCIAAYVNKLPIFGEIGLLSHLLWTDWVILLLFPVVALGIYSVKKWGWYLFVGFSIVLIGYNLLVYFFLNPNYNFLTLFAFILMITATSAVFFRKHVYSPYFNPRLRWWENATRYRVTLNSKLFTHNEGTINCQILDISETGCFTDYKGELTEGDSVWLLISCSGSEINCLGKIVRKAGTGNRVSGYGILFQALPGETKCKLRGLVRSLEELGARDREDSIPEVRIPKDYFEKGKSLFYQLRCKVSAAF
jgi:hypothetical protein